jgi:DeoR family transcriptional regulator, fructose operon transcriptional repressor
VPSTAAEERRRTVLDWIRTEGRGDVTELATRLQVAAETVRRDLAVLEVHGLVRRTHGGAFPTDGARFESALVHRSSHLVSEKRRIAQAAALNLNGAETIYLDEGSTQQLIAEELVKLDHPLTVITPSLGAAAVLATAESVSILLLGGRVRHRTLGTVDHWATDMLADLVIDMAILGANGISVRHGLTTPDPSVCAVKTKAVEVSKRRLFTGVSDKFGVNSFCRFADVAKFETLITDSGLSVHEAARYRALGPHVIRV